MRTSRDNYWFPAKRFGWGWGLPRRWQGWLVLGVFFGLFGLGVIYLQESARPVEFIAFASVLTLGMLVVCWIKGEPPRWRWGGE